MDLQELIDYYLRLPEYSTRCSNDALITDSSNTEASQFWEGQICVAVKDGALHFLFENTGSKFHGKGFKMLAVLNQHCCPDSVVNVFTTLMSLFKDVQSDSESILEFHSRFDGSILDTKHWKTLRLSPLSRMWHTMTASNLLTLVRSLLAPVVTKLQRQMLTSKAMNGLLPLNGCLYIKSKASKLVGLVHSWGQAFALSATTQRSLGMSQPIVPC